MMAAEDKVGGTHPQEQPTRMPGWCKRNKNYWIPALVVLLFVLILLVSLLASKGGSDMMFGRKWNHWEQQKVELDFQPQFVKLTGTWNDRLVVAGRFNNNNKNVVKDYQVNPDNSNEWLENGSFVVEDSIESMDVSETGSRVALALSNPVRVQVFDRKDNVWSQYGETIEMTSLGITGSDLESPTVLLSSDGKVMAIGVPGQMVHVLKDVNTLGNSIVGGFWDFLGEPLDNLHDEDHGQFATYIGLSGDGRKLAVASEKQTLSVHRLNVEDKWGLFAEYDESPLVGSGSIALSRDGNTVAVGGYDAILEGTGELHVINDDLTWYLHNEDLVENSNIKVALSEDGGFLLLGHFPQTGEATLQVFEFNKYQNEWMDRGTIANFEGQNGDIDMSDDGLRVAAVSNNNLYLYEYQGW